MTKHEFTQLFCAFIVVQGAVLVLMMTRAGQFVMLPLFWVRNSGGGSTNRARQALLTGGNYLPVFRGRCEEDVTLARKTWGQGSPRPVIVFWRSAITFATPTWPIALFVGLFAYSTEILSYPGLMAVGWLCWCFIDVVREAHRFTAILAGLDSRAGFDA